MKCLENKIEDTPEKLEDKNQKLDEGLKSLKNTKTENFDSFSEQVQIGQQFNWILKFLNNNKNIIELILI